MTDRNKEIPWQHLASVVLLVLVVVSSGMFARILFAPVPPSEWMPALIALSIAAAAFGAGYRGQLDDHWAVGKGHSLVKFIKVGRSQQEGLFLFSAFLLLTAYVGFFFVSAKMAQKNLTASEFPPAYILVGVVAAITMGIFSCFAVRYARHNRRSSLLKGGLDGCLESGAVLTEKDRRSLVDHLYNEVFKADHLYEPPGNVFVTTGITATFLGLAIGLVTLDLGAMLTPGEGDLAGRAAMQSFMACIGLALGASMVGVVMAMLAQGLRGHGPNECSEDLLRRTEVFLREGQ